MKTVKIEQPNAGEPDWRRRGVAGCFGALLSGPVIGVGLSYAVGWQTGLAVAGVCFLAICAWSLLQFTRAGSTNSLPATWSFTPIGAGLIAATDVLATSSDVFSPGTYLLLSIPAALLGGAGVFLTEILESGRPFVSVSKACIASMLIAVPLPVGGLLGAGASWGHRAFRKAPEKV
ncbi:MAG: hypothetical protein ACI8TQ_001387 [Planctomycetota bacterium]|jgi:hypothetical protein